MSVLQFMFHRKNKENIPSAEDAIQKLKQTEEMLEKKQEFLEKKIDIEIQTAKKHARTNKRIALQALKRKKRFQKQLDQIDGTLSTIEFQREALENSGMNTEVLKNMNFAAKTLKSVHDKLDIDNVHDIMDDIQEQTQISDEISQAMSSIGSIHDFDDDDLDAELEALEDEDDKQSTERLPRGIGNCLPNVPSAEPPTTNLQGDDELRELEAWAL